VEKTNGDGTVGKASDLQFIRHGFEIRTLTKTQHRTKTSLL